MSQSLFARIESVLKSTIQKPSISSSLEELTTRARAWYARRNVKFQWPSWKDVYGDHDSGIVFLGSIFCGAVGILIGMIGQLAWHGAWFWKIASVPVFSIASIVILMGLYAIFGYPFHVTLRIFSYIEERKGENLQVSELLSHYMDAEIERCKNQTLGKKSPIITVKREIERVGQELRTLKEQFSVALQDTQEDLRGALQNGFERVEDLLKRLDESENRVRSHQAKFEAFFEECKGHAHKVGGPLKTRQLFEKLAHYEKDAVAVLGSIDEVLYVSTIQVEQVLRQITEKNEILLRESGAVAGLSGRNHDESVKLLEGTIQRLMDETEIPLLAHQKKETV